jgi:hypothetical protein
MKTNKFVNLIFICLVEQEMWVQHFNIFPVHCRPRHRLLTPDMQRTSSSRGRITSKTAWDAVSIT